MILITQKCKQHEKPSPKDVHYRYRRHSIPSLSSRQLKKESIIRKYAFQGTNPSKG